MESKKERIVSRVKEMRMTRGMSQKELAERVRVGRQAIYDMESGRYVPNTMVALRMAKVLACAIEDLFHIIEEEPRVQSVVLAERDIAPGSRLSLVQVAEQLVAYPQDGRWLLIEGFQAADGLLADGRAQLIHDQQRLQERILLLGCDPAFSILNDHVRRLGHGAELFCRFASSQRALAGLQAGQAHLAAAHLHQQEANVEAARAMLGNNQAIVVAFSSFEEGLVVAAGNPLALRGVADLNRPGRRMVNREAGAATRVLLDDLFAQAGIERKAISGYDHIVTSHLQGAQMVAYGLVDAALGLRAVAAAYGLSFVPLATVRCDLIIPVAFLDHPAMKVMLDCLQTSALRRDLLALPGYDSSCTGKTIAEINTNS